jgi:polyhydroxybutyrate depolymerase
MPETLTITHGSFSRDCLIHRPPVDDGRTPLPMLLILHGAGGTAAWTLEETNWGATANRAGFLAVLPEAMRPDPSRPPGFLHNPQVWNDGAPQRLPDQPAIDDVGFLNALLDELPHRYSIDAGRVFVTGFSNGAGMAFRLGAELSWRFTALAPVAGHCWQIDPHPVRALPTLYIVGSADPLVPLHGGEVLTPWSGLPVVKPPIRQTVQRWSTALGCPVMPLQEHTQGGVHTELYGPGRDGAQLNVHILDGLGHHWPGGRGLLSRRIAGASSSPLRANDVIWEFFQQYGG